MTGKVLQHSVKAFLLPKIMLGWYQQLLRSTVEHWEDRNCSKAYLNIIDERQSALEIFEESDDLDEFQSRLRELDDRSKDLGPEDFGLSNGDYFVDLTFGIRKLYKIEDGRLLRHDTNDWWYKTREETLEFAMGMTRKGKWMRFREAPLGR